VARKLAWEPETQMGAKISRSPPPVNMAERLLPR
jgi:hypothetical protein